MSPRIHDPYAAPGEYRKAQLHCHTTESDGRFRPRELLRRYKEAGYSFVAITDHNRVTRCDELDDATFLALPGMEDTISRPFPPLGPHLGRLFVEYPLREGTAQQRIDQTVASDGIASLCHPSWTGNLWTGRWREEAVTSLRGYRLVEIWNPHSDSRTDLRLWDAALRARGEGVPVWGIAVDDCHHAGQFNRGWVMAKVAEISAAGLRSALTSGAFYSSTGPAATFGVRGERIEAEFSELLEARVVDHRGQVRTAEQSRGLRYAPQGDERYVRIEARIDTGAVWSQPFWLDHAG